MARILEGQNSAKPEEIASFVDEIERLEAEHLEFKMTKMAEISASQSRLATAINEQLDDAKSKGAKKATINAVRKMRAADRAAKERVSNAEQAVNDLEPDEKKIAINIFKALGDNFASFGLGAAAVKAERKTGEQDPTTKAIVDAADKEWNDADPKKNKKPAAAGAPAH